MADIVTDVNEPEVPEAEDLETPQPTEQVIEPEKAEETKPEEPELPEKLKGKSVVDIFKLYEEAEKKSSRLGNEVHEVRQLADQLLRSQLAKKPEPEKPKEVDLFENPQEFVRQAVESNPRLQEAQQYAMNSLKELNRQRLSQKHPDLMDVVKEPQFIDWIKASPIRINLFNQADQNYDFDAGDELLSTYKALHKVVPRETSTIEKQNIKQTVKAATVETGGTNESSRKVYRRVDLMRLMTKDPDRYEAMSDEIMKAYQEGRVK